MRSAIYILLSILAFVVSTYAKDECSQYTDKLTCINTLGGGCAYCEYDQQCYTFDPCTNSIMRDNKNVTCQGGYTHYGGISCSAYINESIQIAAILLTILGSAVIVCIIWVMIYKIKPILNVNTIMLACYSLTLGCVVTLGILTNVLISYDNMGQYKNYVVNMLIIFGVVWIIPVIIHGTICCIKYVKDYKSRDNSLDYEIVN